MVDNDGVQDATRNGPGCAKGHNIMNGYVVDCRLALALPKLILNPVYRSTKHDAPTHINSHSQFHCSCSAQNSYYDAFVPAYIELMPLYGFNLLGPGNGGTSGPSHSFNVPRTKNFRSVGEITTAQPVSELSRTSFVLPLFRVSGIGEYFLSKGDA